MATRDDIEEGAYREYVEEVAYKEYVEGVKPTKYMVEIESNTDNLDDLRHELQICIGAVESSTFINIIQIEVAE